MKVHSSQNTQLAKPQTYVILNKALYGGTNYRGGTHES